jgi:hypothetical protein
LYNNTERGYQNDGVHGDRMLRKYNLYLLDNKNFTVADIDRIFHTHFNVIHVRHPLTRLQSSYYDKVTYKFTDTVSKRGVSLLEGSQNDIKIGKSKIDFKWFIHNLINATHYDIHWFPYSEFKPCSLPYR